jgi:hypothetical protein
MTNTELLKKIQKAAESNAVALDLSNSGITELPPGFFQLTSLTSLNLSWNQLTKLPPEIGQLTNLRDIDLWNNELTSLPQEFAKLANLGMLNLGGNQLSTLPLEICQLTKLRRLRLGENQLTELPPEIGQLTKLIELTLFKNRLSTLPSEIGQLIKLIVLNLSDNRLFPLPLEICRLTDLTELNLSHNQVKELPPEIGQLINLRVLDLWGNQLTGLPPEISQLRELATLNLSINNISPLPPQLFQITGLRLLNLSNNQLTELPPEIGQLINLRVLDLWGNQLTELPLEIAELTSIRVLNFGHNQLTKLPPEITQLTNVEKLTFDDNPLASPPWETAIKGMEAIRAYFVELEKGGLPVNEVKIILVGEGAAGKTSLVNRLIGKEFNPEEETTYGINIRSWDIEAGDRKIKGNIWDFGGQVIMHATHQFFLSKRSLYVLVLDGRKEEKAEYWLRHIESFGGDSSVLIVLNKCDADAAYDLNRPFLLKKYPSIKGFYRTSCANNIGIDEFKAALIKELEQVKMIGTLWPRSWFKVKERLEQRPKPYISCDEYKTFCEEAGIREADSRETLIDFLNDLGVAIHFKEFDLNGTFVLDPKWVTAAVYKIITAEKVVAAKGILHVNSLTEILKKQDKDVHDFPVSKHLFILDLMKQFQLCYCLDNETVLIPQLLDIVEAKFEFDYASSLQFAFLYDDFLPVSILPRFMVKVHNDIRDTQCWLTGVVLDDKKSGSTAVVKADAEKRRISIWVNGPRRKEYLHVLWYLLREINASFEKLPVRERIPMPDDPDRTADYETLLKHVKRGSDLYYAEGSDKEYSVKELLGLVQPKGKDEIGNVIKSIVEYGGRKEIIIIILEHLLEIVKLSVLPPFIMIDLNKLFKILLEEYKKYIAKTSALKCSIPHP